MRQLFRKFRLPANLNPSRSNDWAAPQRARGTTIAEGRLISLLEDWMPHRGGFVLYYPSRRQNPAALQAFIDFLRATVKLS